MRSPLGRGLLAAVVVAVGLVVFRSCVGCGGKHQPTVLSGLPVRLAGEWVSEQDSTTLFFTAETNKLVYSALGKDTYDFTSDSERNITIKAEKINFGWGKNESFELVVEIEFVSDNEIMVIYPKVSNVKPHIEGRFRRVVPRNQPSSKAGESDDAELRGVFLGGWSKKQAGGDDDCTLEFTENTATMAFQANKGRTRQKRELNAGNDIVCNYKSEGNRVSITDPKGHQEWFVVDFVSGREMVFALDRKNDTRTSIPNDGMVETLSGRWSRTTRPAGSLPVSASITAAKLQVQRIEQKLKKVETQQRGVRKERDDIQAKLRELGESADEVKSNPRARNMATSYAKLTAEDEELDSFLATIDTQLLKARSIMRKMELEQAGISDDEMRQLSQQLQEAEARTDTAPRPITPVDVNTALEAAFKARKPSPRDKR